MRAKIRTIGIEVSEELPRMTLDLPSKGAASGAGRKAGKWSGTWLLTTVLVALRGAGAHPLLGGAVGGAMLAVTPVVAAAGAVKGAIEAPSAEAVESQEGLVRTVLHSEQLIHQLKKQVLTQVTARTNVVATILPKDTGDQAGLGEAAPTTGGRQRDAMLRIQLKSIDLRGTFEVDPPLALHLVAQVTLTDSHDPTPLYANTFHVTSESRRLSEWTADDATGFREAVDLSLTRLALKIVDDLFVINPVAHEHPTTPNGHTPTNLMGMGPY